MVNLHASFPANVSVLMEIRRWVEAFLKDNAKKPEGYQFITALDELCANVITHAKPPKGYQQGIEITLRVANDLVSAEVEYAGQEFNISQYQPKKLQELKQQQVKGGLGIRMIRTLTDQIEYIHHDNINTYRLHKSIPNAEMVIA